LFNQIWHDLWITLFVILIIIGVFAAQGLVIGLGVMGLLVAGISWLWNKVSLEDVTYERTISQPRVFIGEETTMSISVTNRKPVPLGRLQIWDEIPEDVQIAEADLTSGANPNSNVLFHSTSMSWYERITWDYKIKSNARGYYRIGPVKMESGDLFGFFNSESRPIVRNYLLVYPKIVPLPEMGLPAVRPLGETRGGIAIFDDPSRPSGIRDYQVGDPLKTVDWKVSAKMQQLQVRTFEPSSSFTVILVVVVETTARSWEGYSPVNLERVITVSASIASYATEMQYNLGLFSNGAPILADRPMKVPPARNAEQLTVILEALATIRPLPIGPMAPQLTQHSREFPIGATLVVIVALINDALKESIAELRRLGHKLVVIYVGSGECPELADGVLIYHLSEHFERLEMSSEFGPR
jgi:uncharacterized protein (DUF58 family)